jgi:hypothetical protein
VTTVQPGGGPTVRRMLVGAQLRRLRTDKEITREQAGEAIRASEWKIHRLDNGQVSFKERDVVDLLRLYGVTDPGEVAALLTMAREANQPGWWFQYSDLLPHWFRGHCCIERSPFPAASTRPLNTADRGHDRVFQSFLAASP